MDTQRKYLMHYLIVRPLKYILFTIILVICLSAIVGGLAVSNLILLLWIVDYVYQVELKLFDSSIKLGITRKEFSKYNFCNLAIIAIACLLFIPLTFDSVGMNFGYSLNGQFEIASNIIFLITSVNLISILRKEFSYKVALVFIALLLIYIFLFDRGLIDIIRAREATLYDIANKKASYVKIINMKFYFKIIIRIILSVVMTIYTWKLNLSRDV